MTRFSAFCDRWKSLSALGFSLAAVAPLFVGLVDQEGYDLGIFSGRVRIDLLLQGILPLWHDGIGFGSPLPVGHDFLPYPLFLTTTFLPLGTFFLLFWVLQVWLGALYTMRLCRRLSIPGDIACLCGLTFALAMPTLNYAIRDEWPTALFTWSLLPVVVFYLQKAVSAGGGREPWFSTIRLGLLLGLYVMKSHPGHLLVLASAVSLFCLFYVPGLRARQWLVVLGAALLAMIMGSDTYAFVLAEAARFPEDVARISQPPLSWLSYLGALIYPIEPEWLTRAVEDSGKDGQAALLSGLRGPFYGTPFFLAALGFAGFAVLRASRRSASLAGVAVAVSFATALVLSVSDLRAVTTLISGAWLYRDPMIFFGILSAGMLLAAWQHSGGAARKLVPLVLVLQGLHLAAAWLPAAWDDFERRASRSAYHLAEADTPFKQWLTASGLRQGERLLLSREVNRLSRYELAGDGIYGLTDFERLGFKVVSGWFKGVSMDAVYPSRAVMHGFIMGDRDVMENQAFLSVGGISWLLLTDSEHQALQNGALREVARFASSAGEDLVLLRNSEAWPVVSTLSAEAPLSNLPRRPDCSLPGLVCSDLDPILSSRLAESVEATLMHGRIRVSLPSSEQSRLLLLSVFAHPDWTAKAEDGEPLTVSALERAFLAVPIPAGLTALELSYRPSWRIGLFWLSYGVLCLTGLVLGLLLVFRRKEHRPS